MPQRYDKALLAYEEALLLNPKDADGYNNKGYILAQFGRYEETLAVYEEALPLAPNDEWRNAYQAMMVWW